MAHLIKLAYLSPETTPISKQRALVKRVFKKVLKGDLRAAELIMKWSNCYVVDSGHEVDSKPSSKEDRAILERYAAQLARQPAIDQEGDTHDDWRT